MLSVWLALSGFSGLSDQAEKDVLQAKTSNPYWQVEMQGGSSVRAYNESAGLELTINLDTVLPSSPQCLSNKKIKDVKMSIRIRKVAQKGDTDWQKSFEKTRILFGSGGERAERKAYGSSLVKNNLKVSLGTIVNVGTLEFLAPFPCRELSKTSMRLSGMLSGGRAVVPLDLTFSEQK
jgi:hypothetical protein